MFGALALSLGYVIAGFSTNLWQFAIAQGLLVGALGSSTTFGPLIADVSYWFTRRRGIAVAICASGNYFAGTFWPPIVQHFIETVGWRTTHIGIGVFCAVTMLPLALVLRRRAPRQPVAAVGAVSAGTRGSLGLPPNMLTGLLWVAGLACCVAMSMPQVHIVAYCGDLGYGVARGAEMLSIMLAFGIISRIGSGFVADRIGGLATLADRLDAAGRSAAAVSVLRRPDVALHYFGAVRPVPGRHRPELCDHRAGIFPAGRGRDARRYCA